MIEVSREQYEMLLKGKWSGFVSMNVGGITTEYVVTEGYGKPDRFGNFSYFIEVGLATPAPPMTKPVGNLDEETSPLLQPSPRSKKVYVADLKGHKSISQWLTEGKVYEARGYCPLVVENDRLIYVECDTGEIFSFSKHWFKEVYLYDEDETLLTCRDIEFKEGDYLDLRKHTPEQIRHIAEYYKFYKLEETLGELDVEGWIYLAWDSDNEFVATTSKSDLGDKEYTYDDIFYSGEV